MVVIDAGSSGSRAYVYTWAGQGADEGVLQKLKLLPGEEIRVNGGACHCGLHLCIRFVSVRMADAGQDRYF